jgi:ABC-type phosphate/phosphonate transport system substrate-binding protein
MPGAFEAFWESPTYSHCNFTVLEGMSQERTDPWLENLLAMDWDNPEHRPILEMEGLRQWVLPRLEGYDSLFEAVREQDIPPRW